MTTVIKIGGVLLEDPQKAVLAIRRVRTDRVAIVHGGGLQITRMLERMDVRSSFKIGGVLLEDPQKAVLAIRRVRTDRVAIVHGGGLQITRMLERMDVRSSF